MNTHQQNPYTPPQAELADAEPPPGSPVKAVVLGLVVDIGGTLGASVVLGIVYGFHLAASGASGEELAELSANIPLDSWVGIASTVLGCAFSALGGYVCARIAGRSEYKLGAILGVISTLVGLSMAIGYYPQRINVTLAVVTFLAVMLGARIGYIRNRSARAAPAAGRKT
jgi:hypothetical protein